MAKSVRNIKSGETQRVSDAAARELVDQGWQYISKSDWKRVTGATSPAKSPPHAAPRS